MMRRDTRYSGFTLIELSIVLVIIGLIVGGVLVGQSLISAAAVRAQITQIEKFNQAVNTFFGKYGGLPGDLPSTAASQFGFTIGSGCTGAQGSRDGNGLLESLATPYNQLQGEGEVALFWADLSSSGLIEGAYPNGGAAAVACNGNSGAYSFSTTTGTTYIGDYFPVAKIGNGNFVSVYGINGYNWYAVSALTTVSNATVTANTNIRVADAYSIDTKIDDGLPFSGRVQAQYQCGTGGTCAAPGQFSISDSTTTCMSLNTSNNLRYYSLSSAANFGVMPNCALSFKMQAGD